MERVVWYIREWLPKSGHCEKVKYPVFLDGERAGTRRYSRTVNRAEKNAMEAVREFTLLLNNNFAAEKDSYMTLDYSDEGIDRLVMRAGTDDAEELYLSAEREASNYVKRCRRACKAAGVELRYAYVTSDMDGQTGDPARVHHHMVVNAEAAEICAGCWTAGGCKPRVLWGENHGDLAVLAEYMIKQVRDMPGRHRYHPSRSLEKVTPSKPRLARNPDAPLMLPKGCEFVYRSETRAGRAQVLRYWRPEALRKRQRKKQDTGGLDDETGEE